MSGSKIIRLEHADGHWVELKDMPNSFTNYWYRSSNVTEWEKRSYYVTNTIAGVAKDYERQGYVQVNKSYSDLGLWVEPAEETQVEKSKHKCTCDSWVLFQRGCQCGGI